MLAILITIPLVELFTKELFVHRRITLSALVCAAALSAPAMATTYPLTLTDTSGQTLTLQQEPKRIVVQDGRDILTLALLDRANPFDRLVARNNLLKKSDAATGTSCKANGRQRKTSSIWGSATRAKSIWKA